VTLPPVLLSAEQIDTRVNELAAEIDGRMRVPDSWF
jgi:hypothetical protein